MKTSDFYYDLPEELIAQTPLEKRDESRMLICNRNNEKFEHSYFYRLPDMLNKGDLVIVNQTKVIPARLLGIKKDTGVPSEILLLKRLDARHWETLVRPGRRLKKGTEISFGNDDLTAIIGDTTSAGGRIVEFEFKDVFEELLDRLGQMPLPPYIHEKLEDRNRYQTVYAKYEGSAAAPTAGLHFTEEVLARLKEKGVELAALTLHVGLGTFRPVKVENVENHLMHEEYYDLSEEVANKINETKKNGGRIVAIGTTVVRTLETLANDDGTIKAGSGNTSIFIYPGKKIKIVDMLLTNFHLPESTLLMLVSAFMGKENALNKYEIAVKERYRFFSFGDCMLLGNDIVK